MDTFLIERTIPPIFHPQDPADVAMHCRWAADAYRTVGAFWLGGAVAEDRMFSLATAEEIGDLHRYRKLLGIAETDLRIRRVSQVLGPFMAGPRV